MAETDPLPAWFTADRHALEDWLEQRAGSRDWSVRHARPWSVVGRVGGTGPWVKATPPASRHEVAVVEVLAGLAPEHLPRVLATDRDRGWILLGDGGPVLRSLEGGPGVADTWAGVLRAYAAIQRASEPVLDELVAAGLPDARGAALVTRFDELFHDDAVMGRGQPWGLTPDDDARLDGVRPRLSDWSERLDTSPVAAAVQHDDLHGNNVFVTGPRVFDWGDAAASHPFASMTATLRSIPHHTPALADDLGPLVAAYLDAWSEVAAPDRLHTDLRLARRVGAVMRAMSWARAQQCTTAATRDREAAPGWLLELLAPPPDRP